MGLNQVKKDLRELEIASGWNTDDMDIAYAKIHHSHNPSLNYITAEFKMPALSKQFGEKSSLEIEDTYHYPALHRMRFNEVENMAFHKYMQKEGLSSIDKIRYYEGTRLITYYMSSSRTLGLLEHDYEMALLVYLNYPKRFFTRRTPCKQIDPRCIPGCLDTLKEPIVHWLDDPEPDTARLDKFFFSYAGDTHRLCMGYTVEDIKDNTTCFEPAEPKYYTLDLGVKYFKEAIWRRREWENKILSNRANLDEEIFNIYDRSVDDGVDEEHPLEESGVQFSGYGGYASLVKYNPKKGINVPKPLIDAIDNNSFTELWRMDMKSINSRNSIHKWTYNHWIEIGNNAENGWWCSWDASEVISEGGDTATALGDSSRQVEAQLNQLANTFGWGSTNDNSSSDTQYNIIIPKYNGYTYIEHTEPLS